VSPPGAASDGLRITIAHPTVWPEVRRGAERYADDLAWFLRGQGHEVTLLTGTIGPTAVDRRPDGVIVHRVHHVGMAKLGRLGIDPVQAFGLTIAPVLRRERPDVVHAMVPSAAVASRLVGVPVLFTFIGHPTAAQFGERRREWLLHRAASVASTTTAALSTASADSVQQLFGRRPVILPPGVRVDAFSVGGRAPSSPVRLLFSAAPDDRRKRLDLLMRAMPAVLDRWPGARLLVSGQGDPTWAFATLGPDRRRVEEAVDLLGAGTPDDLPLRYRSATVSVLPAVDEAFGISVVESLASGTPVVCSDDAGMVDLVTAEVGRTHRADDAGSLATAVCETVELGTAPDLAARCAAHARRWDWQDAVGPLHEDLYRRISRPPRPSEMAPR
jgi:phosphatidylinositol alpha-mannosyltransferase